MPYGDRTVDDYIEEMQAAGGRPKPPPKFGHQGGLRRLLGIYSPQEQAQLDYQKRLQAWEDLQTRLKTAELQEKRQKADEAAREKAEAAAQKAEDKHKKAQADYEAAVKEHDRLKLEYEEMKASPLKTSEKSVAIRKNIEEAKVKSEDAKDALHSSALRATEALRSTQLGLYKPGTDKALDARIERVQKQYQSALGKAKEADAAVPALEKQLEETERTSREGEESRRKMALGNIERQIGVTDRHIGEAKAAGAQPIGEPGAAPAQPAAPAPMQLPGGAPQQQQQVMQPGAVQPPAGPAAGPTAAPQAGGQRGGMNPIMGALALAADGKAGGSNKNIPKGAPATMQPAAGGGPVPITNSLYDPTTGFFTGQTGVDLWKKQQVAGQAAPPSPSPAGPGAAPLPPSRSPGLGGAQAPAQVGGGAPQPMGGGLPTLALQPGAPSLGFQQPDTRRWQDSIAKIESGGNYGALGPVTKTGDRAYGKYQIMGNNIPEWSKSALGYSVSKDQFLKDPKLQDFVFNHQFGQYVNKYGEEGAARAWLGGPGSVNKPGRKDQLGTSVESYGKQFVSGLGGAAPQKSSAPMPFQVPGQQPAAKQAAPTHTPQKRPQAPAGGPLAPSVQQSEVQPNSPPPAAQQAPQQPQNQLYPPAAAPQVQAPGNPTGMPTGKPPMEGARLAPDGNWYVMKGGKYYPVIEDK